MGAVIPDRVDAAAAAVTGTADSEVVDECDSDFD